MSNLNLRYSKLLENLKLERFNSMQQAVITEGSKGESLVVLSPTGTGKTLSFLTVIANRLTASDDNVTSSIVVPSRELALQIEGVFRSIKSNAKVTCCYGGHSSKIERQRLKQPPALVIGTPGRIVDHVRRGALDLSSVDLVVLDEFDKLLELGFEQEIEELFTCFKVEKQVILSSASTIQRFPRCLKKVTFVTLDFRKQDRADNRLQLRLVLAEVEKKMDSLASLLRECNQEPTIVFCNHREAVERVSLALEQKTIEHVIFHGGLEQIEREKSVIKVKGGAQTVLIATDLASRGLDIPVIKHVVHFQMPSDGKEFLHRNGRTARMHAKGTAYLLIEEGEQLPDYVEQDITRFEFDPSLTFDSKPEYICVYVSAGRKNKISKGDLLGFLTKVGKLSGNDIGLISVLDKASYVCVRREKAESFLHGLKAPKIKKIKVKIQVAN